MLGNGPIIWRQGPDILLSLRPCIVSTLGPFPVFFHLTAYMTITVDLDLKSHIK